MSTCGYQLLVGVELYECSPWRLTTRRCVVTGQGFGKPFVTRFRNNPGSVRILQRMDWNMKEYWRGTEAKFVLELYPVGFLNGLSDAISLSQRVFSARAGVMRKNTSLCGVLWCFAFRRFYNWYMSMQRPTSTAVALLCTDAGAGGTQLPIALKGQWIFWRYTFVMLIDRPLLLE